MSLKNISFLLTAFYSKIKKQVSLASLTFLIIFLPIISFADADRIFKENNGAVVVVVALDKEGIPIRQGSGFVVRQDGAIVTNYHVIEICQRH